MNELFNLLCDAVSTSGVHEKVALLLSGGIDSTSVGLALTASGRSVRAYTYEVEGFPSEDLAKAEAVARHFGWPLHVVSIATRCLQHGFLRLAVQHKASRKVEFEVGFPLLHMLQSITETEIWTGWNADDYYGNTRKVSLDQFAMTVAGVTKRERKRRFDEYRQQHYRDTLQNEMSADSWWLAKRIVARHGKSLHDPYLDEAVFRHFLQFDHRQLSAPQKPVVREALAPFLKGLQAKTFTLNVQMQKGGGVDKLFQKLLEDEQINRFTPKYKSVSQLCQRWGREVKRDRARYEACLGTTWTAPPAGSRSDESRYAPYGMADVRRLAGTRKFSVISTFAGGGGSSLGYRLAGASVLAANEFVSEAARTYKANFPDTYVDQRDIRTLLNDGVSSLLAKIGLQPTELDLLDGSPPCSEFSVAGRGMSDDEELKTYSDVQQRNIAELPFDFIKFAAAARPKVVVMENVPALAAERSMHVLEALMQALRFLDGEDQPKAYHVNWRTLFASDFGVPQKRKRLFLVGVRLDVAEVAGIGSDEDILSAYPIPRTSAVTVRDAIRDLKQKPEEVFPWTRAALTSSLNPWIRRLPKNPPRITRPQHIDPDEPNYFTLQRASWDLPAPTLVVFSQQPDGRTGTLHPAFDRKFTLAELKRLSSLPDDFILTGTIAQAAERICRMVPPLLTKALAESIYEKILMPYKETRGDT